jgi:hypothetical protein
MSSFSSRTAKHHSTIAPYVQLPQKTADLHFPSVSLAVVADSALELARKMIYLGMYQWESAKMSILTAIFNRLSRTHATAHLQNQFSWNFMLKMFKT